MSTRRRRSRYLAGLDKFELATSTTHSRKWSAERKHLPHVDVTGCGGWADTRALEMSYQQVDQATMLSVVSQPPKLQDAAGQQAGTAYQAGIRLFMPQERPNLSLSTWSVSGSNR